MCAPDKDSVYDALREKGIRAIKVTERIQPVIRKGFSGLRKRDWSLVLVGLGIVAIAVWTISQTGDDRKRIAEREETVEISSGVVQIAQPHPRKWLELPGDLDLFKVFKHPHEVFLARYAIPGTDICAGGSSTNKTSLMESDVMQDFYDNLNSAIVITEDDPVVIAELKRIVAGMKSDARKYLTQPNGVARLAMWLEERQAMERGYREQYTKRVLRGELSKEDVNAILSTMGLELMK